MKRVKVRDLKPGQKFQMGGDRNVYKLTAGHGDELGVITCLTGRDAGQEGKTENYLFWGEYVSLLWG